MVAVRMVSEGVDVPRLAVGVYATSTSTPLFFAQAVGRFVRARRRGETASIFVPSVPVLLELAAELEVERDHALDKPKKDGEDPQWSPEEGLLAAANREEKASDTLGPGFEALEAQATFDRVLFDSQEFGTEAEVGSAEELDFLGIPGLLEPEQVTTLLRQRQAEQLAARSKRAPARDAAEVVPVAAHREMAALRKELHSLVGAWARRTSEPHATVHASSAPPAAARKWPRRPRISCGPGSRPFAPGSWASADPQSDDQGKVGDHGKGMIPNFSLIVAYPGRRVRRLAERGVPPQVPQEDAEVDRRRHRAVAGVAGVEGDPRCRTWAAAGSGTRIAQRPVEVEDGVEGAARADPGVQLLPLALTGGGPVVQAVPGVRAAERHEGRPVDAQPGGMDLSDDQLVGLDQLAGPSPIPRRCR